MIFCGSSVVFKNYRNGYHEPRVVNQILIELLLRNPFQTNPLTYPVLRRTGPSGQEEWVGNSLVQKGDDDLYTVADTLYNSAISNAKIDVRFFNETDSSQSTLTVQNVETDYDNLFNYFCKVQFNDPDQGMIADLKASDEESFEVFGK